MLNLTPPSHITILSEFCDLPYIKIKGQWRYLYRAVDKEGQTVDFLLTVHCDKKAALHFFKKAARKHSPSDKVAIEGHILSVVEQFYALVVHFRQVIVHLRLGKINITEPLKTLYDSTDL